MTTPTLAGPVLFVRARRAHWYALIIVVTGVAVHLAGAGAVRFHLTDNVTLPWLLFVPVIDAALIGLCTGTAMADWEAQSHRPLRRHITTLLLAELAIAAAATFVAASQLTGNFSASTAVRNLCGFTGMALVSAVLLGSLLAWVIPLLFAAVTLVGGVQTGHLQPWAWPAAPSGHPEATAQALLWLVIGLWLAATITYRQNST